MISCKILGILERKYCYLSSMDNFRRPYYFFSCFCLAEPLNSKNDLSWYFLRQFIHRD